MVLLKNLFMLINGMTFAGFFLLWFSQPNTLSDFCKGNPEVLLKLEGKGLSDGTLYLKCNGKVYQSDIEVITHEYTQSNNQVRAYGNSGLPVEDFEIDTINGGI